MRQTERVKGDQLPYRANKPSGVVAREAAAAQGLRHAFGHHALFGRQARRSPDRCAHALSTGQRASRRAPTEALTPLQMEEDREATWYTVQTANGRAGFALSNQ